MSEYWIPFSRPNWLLHDIEAAAAEYTDYPAPRSGPTVLEHLRTELSELWQVPRSWILLTSSCTEAIGLWGRYIAQTDCLTDPCWMVPAVTWPGSYCELPATERPVINDLCGTNSPVHRHPERQGPTLHVRLYGESHGLSELHPYDVVDSAHDVEFSHMSNRGRLSDVATVYSFGACKELSAERGGALVSAHCISDRLHLLASSGVDRDRRGTGPVGAMKCGMAPSQAALILSQLARFKRDKEIRQELLARYRAMCAGSDVKVLGKSGHLAVLLFPTPHRAGVFQSLMRSKRVRTGHHYKVPLWALRRDAQNAHSFSERIVTVPCFAQWHGMSEMNRALEVTRWALEAADSHPQAPESSPPESSTCQ